MASIRYFRILKRLPLLEHTHQKCTLIETRALATSKALPVHADIQTRTERAVQKEAKTTVERDRTRSAWATGGAESKRKCSINVCLVSGRNLSRYYSLKATNDQKLG